ncbi:hypothetical protein BKA69DRAFT_1042389 [Paraphysoderma sedebokerense]|nr:hypothetical protein BKA69DRAFT_1042389 [Paraphysoderma sedebokerense]
MPDLTFNLQFGGIDFGPILLKIFALSLCQVFRYTWNRLWRDRLKSTCNLAEDIPRHWLFRKQTTKWLRFAIVLTVIMHSVETILNVVAPRDIVVLRNPDFSPEWRRNGSSLETDAMKCLPDNTFTVEPPSPARSTAITISLDPKLGISILMPGGRKLPLRERLITYYYAHVETPDDKFKHSIFAARIMSVFTFRPRTPQDVCSDNTVLGDGKNRTICSDTTVAFFDVTYTEISYGSLDVAPVKECDSYNNKIKNCFMVGQVLDGFGTSGDSFAHANAAMSAVAGKCYTIKETLSFHPLFWGFILLFAVLAFGSSFSSGINRLYDKRATELLLDAFCPTDTPKTPPHDLHLSFVVKNDHMYPSINGRIAVASEANDCETLVSAEGLSKYQSHV